MMVDQRFLKALTYGLGKISVINEIATNRRAMETEENCQDAQLYPPGVTRITFKLGLNDENHAPFEFGRGRIITCYM